MYRFGKSYPWPLLVRRLNIKDGSGNQVAGFERDLDENKELRLKIKVRWFLKVSQENLVQNGKAGISVFNSFRLTVIDKTLAPFLAYGEECVVHQIITFDIYIPAL